MLEGHGWQGHVYSIGAASTSTSCASLSFRGRSGEESEAGRPGHPQIPPYGRNDKNILNLDGVLVTGSLMEFLPIELG